jgi:hypothetical protein
LTPALPHADRARWPRRLAIALGLVALLLGGAVAMLPWLMDSAAVRRVIEREISARAGGKVGYDSLALRLLPRPRAEIRGARVQDAGALAGHAALLDVELSLAALLRGVGGSFRVRGRGGRIQYTRLGPKILALEHVAERVEAEDAAHVVSRGLDFTGIAVVGTLDAGRARLERFTLDSRLLGIGLTGEIDLAGGELALRGVVAPFGNVTSTLRRVPLVGRLFGARIVGVPFSVRGDWRDPRVIPLGPEAIAGSFVDLLSRALNAPIQLLNPFIRSRERAP